MENAGKLQQIRFDGRIKSFAFVLAFYIDVMKHPVEVIFRVPN